MIFFFSSWFLKLPLLIQEKFERRPLKSTAGSGEQISRVGSLAGVGFVFSLFLLHPVSLPLRVELLY